jgi:hypothetical protein
MRVLPINLRIHFPQKNSAVKTMWRNVACGAPAIDLITVDLNSNRIIGGVDGLFLSADRNDVAHSRDHDFCI